LEKNPTMLEENCSPSFTAVSSEVLDLSAFYRLVPLHKKKSATSLLQVSKSVIYSMLHVGMEHLVEGVCPVTNYFMQ